MSTETTALETTTVDIQALTPELVMKVYSGKQGCMCGCRGKYWVHPNHRAEADKDRGYAHDDDEVSAKQVKRILGILKADPRTKVQDGYILYLDREQLAEGERSYVAYLCHAARAS